MRLSVVRVGAAAVIALGIAIAGSSAANAESIMKECGSEWQAAKAAGTTNGQTWQEFLKSCRVQHQGGAQAPAAPAAQAAPAPAQRPRLRRSPGSPPKSATPSTPQTKPRSDPQVRGRPTSSPHAARVTRQFRKALPPRRRRLLPRRKTPDRCSPGSSPLLRPPLRLWLRRRRPPRPAPASSRLSSRPSTAARATPWFGSTTTPASITSLARITTATRRRARTCARRTRRRREIAPRRTKSTRRLETISHARRDLAVATKGDLSEQSSRSKSCGTFESPIPAAAPTSRGSAGRLAARPPPTPDADHPASRPVSVLAPRSAERCPAAGAAASARLSPAPSSKGRLPLASSG